MSISVAVASIDWPLSARLRSSFGSEVGSVLANVSDFDDAPDAELLSRAVEEDAEALGALFERHREQLARWCLRFAGNEEDAADLVQETFLKAQRGLPRFRGQCKFSTWIYTIARRTALNRSQKAENRMTSSLGEETAASLMSDEETADEVVLELEQVQELRRQVGRLEPLEREVLRLKFGADLSLPQITRLLGLSNRSGAKAYHQSALRKLRRAGLERHPGETP